MDELRRRQQIQLGHQPRYVEPRPVVTSPHPPSISHLISHSVSPRPSDRHQLIALPIKLPTDSPTIAIPTPSQEDPRPIKKRRYSESPTRPNPDDREHIARERDKMVIGELGYGRVESPIAGPSHPPRRPGSSHGHGRKVAVSDLLTVDKERPPISSTPDRDAHRVLSPMGGRRSPPGSQIGRAKAARKSDEYLLREPPPQHAEPELRKLKDEPKIKHELKSSRSHEAIRSPTVDETRPPKPTTKELPTSLATATAPAPPKAQPSARKGNQEDVYEWFLQQYEEEPSPTMSVRIEPPHTPSPSLSPPTSAAVAPSGAKTPPAPHRSPFAAAVSLEEELEELVSKPQTSSSSLPADVTKQDPDIDMELDVDLAVNELVETLEADDSDVKREPKAMEVDVEDELLSLLDDTPRPSLTSSSSSVSRRNPPSSAGVAISSSSHAAASATLSHTHSHSHSHAVHTKQPQNHNRSASEAPHVSPVISNAAAAALSPVSAVRHSSTRPTPERGSMPPPASTAGAGKKGSDAIASATATAVAASTTMTGSNPTAKKKRESAAKASTAKAKNTNSVAAPTTTSATPAAAKPKAKPAAKGKRGAVTDAVSAGTPGSTSAGPGTGKGVKGPAGTTATGRKTAPSVSASRSRSASVMPAGSASVGPESDAVKAEKQEEEEDSEAEADEDDKLYCVCKTKYDEDRFMIACDRCDEWYHTQCVKMPDLEVDLVDQFICPLCIEKNPYLNLRTTYKPRCLYGLRHPDPSSTKACHKAARGAFSKYCSDECGVKYMQSRIDTYAKKGGKTEKLWDSVKGAEKREGVVCAIEVGSDEEEMVDVAAAKPADTDSKKGDVDECAEVKINDEEEEEEEPKTVKVLGSPRESKPPQQPTAPKMKTKHQHVKTHVVPPTKSKVARETERLNGLLDSVIRLREEIKRGMEIVIWRERLLQLASERAEAVGQCGWDQRLCMDDEEWADIGAGVLESYEDAVLRAEVAKEDSADGGDMEVDGAEEQWWCPGKKVCDRHQGWQTVRFKDVSKEKEKKEEALAKLTTREREIRKRIEDMLEPQNTNHPATANHTTTAIHINSTKEALHAPLKSSAKAVNGHSKSKAATTAPGEAHKKGKKRKVPPS